VLVYLCTFLPVTGLGAVVKLASAAYRSVYQGIQNRGSALRRLRASTFRPYRLEFSLHGHSLSLKHPDFVLKLPNFFRYFSVRLMIGLPAGLSYSLRLATSVDPPCESADDCERRRNPTDNHKDRLNEIHRHAPYCKSVL
jgi:hypothetical protein